jgi:hypothetical protein
MFRDKIGSGAAIRTSAQIALTTFVMVFAVLVELLRACVKKMI